MKMTFGFDLDEAAVRLQCLPPEYASDPREVEGGAEVYNEHLYDVLEDGRHVLNTGKRDELVQEIGRLRLREENRRLKDEADRSRVISELRRVMRATGVKPGLVDAAVALHLETHRFAIDDDGKVHVLGPSGTVTDALQAAVRWIERDEHRDLKGGTVTTEEGEFTRMVAALRN